MLTLLFLTLLALVLEVFIFATAVLLCILPIIGIFKFIEWLLDR